MRLHPRQAGLELVRWQCPTQVSGLLNTLKAPAARDTSECCHSAAKLMALPWARFSILCDTGKIFQVLEPSHCREYAHPSLPLSRSGAAQNHDRHLCKRWGQTGNCSLWPRPGPLLPRDFPTSHLQAHFLPRTTFPFAAATF